MDYQEYVELREYFVKLIEEKNLKELKQVVSEMNVVDIAEVIEDLEDKQMLLVFRMLPKDMGSDVFSYMEMYNKKRIINSITDEELHSILDELYFDDMVDVIEEMPANVVTKVLKKAPADRRKLINDFLRYPEDSAGSIMTIEYVSLKPEMTVKEALDYIKKVGIDKETIYTCYVENEYKMLIGFVSLRTIVTSDETQIIKNIMEEDVIFVTTQDDQEEVADIFTRYGYLALPVVDQEHRLCGIITFDDILDIVEAEATEDFHKMAAVAPSDDEYLDQSAWQLAKNRIPWLLILMISATATTAIIGRFDALIAQYVVLSSFIPMITDTGGNAGSQASTVVIRAMATGEIGFGDGLKVIWKEIRVGMIAGATLGLANFFRIWLFTSNGPLLAGMVSVTILFTVLFSKLLGALLPILAKKVNLDPAIMASALITTIIDSLALMVYFLMAEAFLGI
ncbi:magnesium transporter [Peptoniphilus duerdenii]|uniref:Magnesium transporter MgtE n=1 Tax=Peptoniphilus duerdenii ATCC BAA-1640 TaxID=862517 RepID=E0NL36_9FIRM|nr:magnesium transporter [Peptoniphilus duerdenii]EFM25469.1 magnesium transporter [Peptoniphilus duerdenii ATCC BAA-1640]